MKLKFVAALLLLGSAAAAVVRKNASHATKSISSTLKPANENSLEPMNELVDFDLTEEEKRALGGYTGTIYINIWDLDDCDNGKGGPRCPDGDGDGSDEGSDEGGGDETTTTTSSLIACDGDIDSDASTAKVTWHFTVESSSEDPSSVAEKVCGAMSNAVIGSADEQCGSSSRRRLNERRLEIQGYSKDGVTCTYETDCIETHPASESCAVYQAEVEIAYDDEGDNASAGEVSSTVTDAAEDALNGGGVEATVADELEDSDESLTHVGFGDPNVQEEVGAGLSGETYQEKSQGLTRAQKMVAGFMSALVLLLLILCCVCWRRRNRGSDSKSVDTGDTQLSPGRGGRGGSGSYSDDDDMTYVTSDFDNLGLHHSKLDVHNCASATCQECNPVFSNDVTFVSSKGGAPLSDIIEEEYNSSSEYKSTSGRDSPDQDMTGADVPPPPPADIPDPPADDETPVEKKSFFSRFSRTKEPPKEDPIIRTHGTADGDEIEIEI